MRNPLSIETSVAKFIVTSVMCQPDVDWLSKQNNLLLQCLDKLEYHQEYL